MIELLFNITHRATDYKIINFNFNSHKHCHFMYYTAREKDINLPILNCMYIIAMYTKYVCKVQLINIKKSHNTLIMEIYGILL